MERGKEQWVITYFWSNRSWWWYNRFYGSKRSCFDQTVTEDEEKYFRGFLDDGLEDIEFVMIIHFCLWYRQWHHARKQQNIFSDFTEDLFFDFEASEEEEDEYEGGLDIETKDEECKD